MEQLCSISGMKDAFYVKPVVWQLSWKKELSVQHIYSHTLFTAALACSVLKANLTVTLQESLCININS